MCCGCTCARCACQLLWAVEVELIFRAVRKKVVLPVRGAQGPPPPRCRSCAGRCLHCTGACQCPPASAPLQGDAFDEGHLACASPLPPADTQHGRQLRILQPARQQNTTEEVVGLRAGQSSDELIAALGQLKAKVGPYCVAQRATSMGHRLREALCSLKCAPGCCGCRTNVALLPAPPRRCCE